MNAEKCSLLYLSFNLCSFPVGRCCREDRWSFSPSNQQQLYLYLFFFFAPSEVSRSGHGAGVGARRTAAAARVRGAALRMSSCRCGASGRATGGPVRTRARVRVCLRTVFPCIATIYRPRQTSGSVCPSVFECVITVLPTFLQRTRSKLLPCLDQR